MNFWSTFVSRLNWKTKNIRLKNSRKFTSFQSHSMWSFYPSCKKHVFRKCCFNQISLLLWNGKVFTVVIRWKCGPLLEIFGKRTSAADTQKKGTISYNIGCYPFEFFTNTQNWQYWHYCQLCLSHVFAVSFFICTIWC